MSMLGVVPVAEVPETRTSATAAALAAATNRTYARLLSSGTAVTTTQYVDALSERGMTAGAARSRIKRSRSAGRMVTIAQDGEALIPVFQLTDAFDHDDVAETVVVALTGAGWSSWAVWDWAEGPNAWLDGRRPADAIHTRDTEGIVRALDAAVGPGPAA